MYVHEPHCQNLAMHYTKDVGLSLEDLSIFIKYVTIFEKKILTSMIKIETDCYNCHN